VPQELGIARDGRCLGVALRRIVLAQVRRQRAIEAEATALDDGWHLFEPEIGVRWTNGNALVPHSLFTGMSGASMLILQTGPATQYLDDGISVRAA
jgi:hypothetical protein